jgi:tetratricopeptide (TPR) repeat protein
VTAFALKPLSKDAIPAAHEKAERYRLLNEPAQAESICLDILAADPGNERATITLLLAQTDMFEADATAFLAARETLSHIKDPYLRAYYDGLLHERRAHAVLKRGLPGAGEAAYGHFRDAMEEYEAAEKVRPAGNDDARLRFNACARILNSRPDIRPDTSDRDHGRDTEA